ncbi:MAG: VanZ family protein [Candidatus Aureabacteria bacterium]|nr:VanZ family protein [Candidatus Auribacterota bacterium]
MIRRNKIVYWLPALAYMAAIFTISSFSLKVPQLKTGLDKIVHMAEYAILSFLLLYSFLKTTRMSRSKIEITAIILTTLYGISDEIHQYFVPLRECDLMDILFDALGSFWIYLARLGKNNLNIKNKK